jgi:hypothetical protein
MKMRPILLALLVASLAASSLAAVDTWKHVVLVDAMCAENVKANPDRHTTDCAIHCAGAGLGVLTADSTFLKFDDAGTKQALAVMKATTKKDHLRATVTGERAGNTIKVKSLKLD